MKDPHCLCGSLTRGTNHSSSKHAALCVWAQFEFLRLIQGPDLKHCDSHTWRILNCRCYVGKPVKTKYLSWLCHARKISFPFLCFGGGGIAVPVRGGAGSQSQRAAAVLILGLASPHTTADWLRIRPASTGTDIFPIWSFSDVLVIFPLASFSYSCYSSCLLLDLSFLLFSCHLLDSVFLT